MTFPQNILVCSMIAFISTAVLPGRAVAKAQNVVLVHGMNMDASTWRAVFDLLRADDYRVTAVQLPLTSIEDDIAATRRALEKQDGSVVLVGHSYGGMVISQAGTDSHVKALVYVAAFLPEKGESLSSLNASAPAELPPSALTVFDDGAYIVDPDAWIADVASDLPQADALFSAMSQAASNTAIFGYEAEVAAWHDKPAWSAIATRDRAVSPALQRRMSERSGATVIEIDGGHLLQMTHPKEITALIEKAATSVN